MGLWQIDMDSESSDEDELDVPPLSNDPAIQWLICSMGSLKRDVKVLKRDMKGVKRNIKDMKEEIKELKEEGDPCIQELQKVIKGIYVWYFYDKSLKLK